MRIPLTPHGRREILLFGVVPLLAGLALWATVGWWAGIVPLGLAVFVFSFFRDPERPVPAGPGLLVSPADGLVTAIGPTEEPLYVRGEALRIGIFLSVFNVHVNRAPCSGVVELVQYCPGKFLDARDARCSTENEANAIGIRMDDGRRVLVRQVAGLIARRIVCPVRVGDRVKRGQRMGMIKFGSYTELLVEAGAGYEPRVGIKQVVHGASDVLMEKRGG